MGVVKESDLDLVEPWNFLGDLELSLSVTLSSKGCCEDKRNYVHHLEHFGGSVVENSALKYERLVDINSVLKHMLNVDGE